MFKKTVNLKMLKNKILEKTGILLLSLVLFSPTIALAQGVKVTWQDPSGREFSITAPTGKLGYTALIGDKISYNFSNQVSKVGDVEIIYNFSNQVSRVGDIVINYNFSNQVVQVGGLRLEYNFSNQITGSSGSVR